MIGSQILSVEKLMVRGNVLPLVCLGCFLLSVTMPVEAAQKGKAVTRLSEVDADYAMQGEYVGLFEWDGYRQYAGFQVIALGKGAFQATLYRGGLPGAGWDHSERITYQGAREGNIVTLEYNGKTARVAANGVVFRDSTGRFLGILQKTHRVSPTIGLRAPANATVLFDGTSTEHFVNGRISDDLLLMEGADTANKVQDFTLHLEFKTPYMPDARGQGRGNSGVYIQGRYEVQILDSFGLEGVHNECGGLYKTQPPSQNMALPPLTWQTYDIIFRAARFDDSGKKIQNAVITVRHNGVLIHDHFEIPNKTGAGAKESPEPGPIRLQNHGDPVRYRNIWIIEGEELPVCQPICYPVSQPCHKRLFKLFRRR